MNSLTRSQKLVLIILTVLDLVVIGAMASVVVMASRNPVAVVEFPTATALATSTLPPTWTPTPTATLQPTLPSRATNTPAPSPTPYPTTTPVPSAVPTDTPIPPTSIPVRLVGADFDYLKPNRIPGWRWDAYVNYKPGDIADPETSYAEPLFDDADDAVRQINGSTLKVETMRWLKFRTWVHQTVTVTAGSRVQFKIRANAFSSLDRLIVRAGIDPLGADNCFNAMWGPEERINQDNGIVVLTSPTIIVPAYLDPDESSDEEPPDDTTEEDPDSEGEAAPVEEVVLGRVTVCFFAEPTYPHVNNAAFFDLAEIIVRPPQ